MPNVLSPRDLVSRPDNMDETVPHIKQDIFLAFQTGGCLLLHESSAESSCATFIQQ